MDQTALVKEKLPLVSLLALSLISFSTLVTELLPAGVLPEMGTDLGASEAQIGMLVSVYAIASAVAAIPGIALTRGMPRKPLLLSLLVIFAVVNTVTALSTNYLLTLVARILAGLSAGVLWPLVGSYASRLVSFQNMGRAIAIALTGSTIALAIGLPLATALVGVVGWRATFGGLTLLAVILCVWVSLKVPSFPGESAQNRESINKVFKIPGVPTILIVTLATILAHYVLYTYIAPYTEALHFYGGTSLALLLFGMGTLVGIALTGKLIDTHFRKTALGTVVLTAVSMLLIGLMGNLPFIAHLSILLWGMSFGGAPTLFQTAANKVADQAKDVVTSMVVTVYNTGIFGGSLAGGLILNVSSAYILPWTVFVLILVSIIFIWNGNRNAFPKTNL